MGVGVGARGSVVFGCGSIRNTICNLDPFTQEGEQAYESRLVSIRRKRSESRKYRFSSASRRNLRQTTECSCDVKLL